MRYLRSALLAATVFTGTWAFAQSPGGPASGEFDVANRPTIQAAAYPALAAIGGLQTFLNVFRQPNGTVILNNTGAWSKSGNTTGLLLYFFKGLPTSSCTDKAAFTLATADIDAGLLVNTAPISLTPAVAGTNTTPTSAFNQLPISVQNKDATTNLYLCAQVAAAVTPVSTTDLVFSISGLKD